MKKILIAILLNCFIVLVSNKNVYAVTTTIDNFNSPISADPFTVNVTISSASAGINYLKIDLYKTSTTNYFGDTFNGSAWVNAGDYSQYFQANIQSGANWSGQFQGRIGSPSATQYDGLGAYKIRVRRYTSSGSYNSTEANNSSLDVTINLPTLTPTPILSPTVTLNPTDPIPAESTTPTVNQPQPTPDSFDNIYISEAMVNPVNGEKEWLELYNDNDFPVSLTSWYIDDVENGGSSPKLFSLNIERKNYAAFDLSAPMFNNSGDSVRLLDFNKYLKDSFEYGQSTQGKTFGRTSINSDDFCLQEPSRNIINNSCINPTPLPTDDSKKINPSPTLSITQTKIPTPHVKKYQTPIIIGQSNLSPTPSISPESASANVLGLSAKMNRPTTNLIKCLTFLSSSYSLLTIISILFKMKLNYGKNKKLYSSSFHPP